MKIIKVKKHEFAHTFGGAGFHNNDATMYHIIDDEHFNQYICKCYRETSPGFMRTFAGFSDWTKEAMDEFADLQDYTAIISKDKPIYTLKPESVTYFTTDYIVKEESIYADGVEIDGGLIKWNAVEDKNHCYYRVFTSNQTDFVPSTENQIASTVSISVKSDKVLKYVKVVSVDKSGNMEVKL